MGAHSEPGGLALFAQFGEFVRYCGRMARGWERKSVEEQKEAAESRRAAAAAIRLTADEVAKQKEIEGLQLSRTRVMHDLEAATHPRHRESLEAALRFLDEKIAALQRSKT